MKKTILLALIGLMQLGYSQSSLDSLKGCYPLDCDDAQNFAPTGTPLNGAVGAVNCTTGHLQQPFTAYQFMGNSSSYIALPGTPAHLKPTNAITVCGWYSTQTTATSQYLVFTKNNCTSNFEAYYLAIVSDGANAQFIAGLNGAACSGATAADNTNININQWYFVVFYIDNSTVDLYVDGSLVASTAHSTSFDYDASGKDVILGGTNESFNLPFTGEMDNVRFYNRALTASEISYLYQYDPGCDGFCTGNLDLVADYDAAIGFNNGSGYSTNYGYAWQNAGYEIPGSGGGSNVNRALIHFDFSAIPSGASIVYANLNLYAYGAVTSYAGHTRSSSNGNDAYIERISSSWTETGATWNNQPSVGTGAGDQINVPGTSNATLDYTNFNIASVVQNILTNGTNDGFRLKLQNESQTNILIFCSKDHPNSAKHPTMNLKYKYRCDDDDDEGRISGVAKRGTSNFNFSLRPNPSTGAFSVNYNLNKQEGNLVISDVQGKVVADLKLDPMFTSQDIDGSNLTPGIYLCKIVSHGNTVAVKKLAITK